METNRFPLRDISFSLSGQSRNGIRQLLGTSHGICCGRLLSLLSGWKMAVDRDKTLFTGIAFSGAYVSACARSAPRLERLDQHPVNTRASGASCCFSGE
jgi:hypothetical protein